MKRSTKIAMVLILSAAVASGAYAKMEGKGSCSMNEGKKMMMKKHMHKKAHNSPMALLKEITLTPKQEEQILAIKKDMMKDKVTPDVAFSKEGFDKAKFMEIMKQKRENMLESKAEMIDKVYKVLTPKQKEQLFTLMQLKKEKKEAYMNKRMSFDKNCNGRG